MANLEIDAPLAVMVSGGLDSVVLLGTAAQQHSAVFPLYVRTGSAWESVELDILKNFLHKLAATNVWPLTVLEQPTADLYGEHWSIRGSAPDSTAPDEDFYLPGRNVILLAKALVWCRLNGVNRLALGTLDANPFPDATPEFFRDFAAVVGRATGSELHVVTPFAAMSKAEVVKLGRDLPLHYSLSCMSPVGGRHCGVCGKCGERGRAFLAAGVADATDYVSRAWESMHQRAATAVPWAD